MEDRERLVGRNLTRLREGRSQKDIADAMRRRGWKWSQATVSSVEQGDRPLRLAEAQDLALVLGKPLERLLTSEPETKVLRALDDAVTTALDLIKATHQFHVAHAALQVAVDEAGVDNLSEGARERTTRELDRTIDDAVATGNRRWRQQLDDVAAEVDRFRATRSEATDG